MREPKDVDREDQSTPGAQYRACAHMCMLSSLDFACAHMCMLSSLDFACAHMCICTVIWFIFVLKIISVFYLGGDLISSCDQTKFT